MHFLLPERRDIKQLLVTHNEEIFIGQPANQSGTRIPVLSQNVGEGGGINSGLFPLSYLSSPGKGRLSVERLHVGFLRKRKKTSKAVSFL
jgi:hypothetical protein